VKEVLLKQRDVYEKVARLGRDTRQRRKRGDGRIWHRGDILWVQYYANGRQVRESSQSSDARKAERLLAKRRAEFEADAFVGPFAQRLRYEQMCDALYADYRANGRKWLRIGENDKAYICGVSHLDRFFGRRRALAISTTFLRAFVIQSVTRTGLQTAQ
jgi:hypothetical protein